MAKIKYTNEQKNILDGINANLSVLKKLQTVYNSLSSETVQDKAVNVVYNLPAAGEQGESRVKIPLKATALCRDIKTHGKFYANEILKNVDKANIDLNEQEKAIVEFFK